MTKGFALDDERLKQGHDVFNRTYKITSSFNHSVRRF